MVSWESLMVSNLVLLNFPVIKKKPKVFLILLIWFASIKTKWYLARLFPFYLMWWFPPFMVLRPLGLLGKLLAHDLLHPQHLEFLLSRGSCNLHNKAPYLAKFFWMKLSPLLMIICCWETY